MTRNEAAEIVRWIEVVGEQGKLDADIAGSVIAKLEGDHPGLLQDAQSAIEQVKLSVKKSNVAWNVAMIIVCLSQVLIFAYCLYM